jgi:hypothetical protein
MDLGLHSIQEDIKRKGNSCFCHIIALDSLIPAGRANKEKELRKTSSVEINKLIYS